LELRVKALRIGDDLRRELSKPWGLLLTNEDIEAGRLREVVGELEPREVVTVGDVTTWVFIKEGVKPRVALVDMKTLRGPCQLDIEKSIPRIAEVFNPPGHIVAGVTRVIEEALRRGGLIVVRGEEDLLVIPAILASPEGAVIAYGQPNVGIVLIRVDKDKKEKARELLSLMQEVEVEVDVDTVPN